jgi:hypothetical protein
LRLRYDGAAKQCYQQDDAKLESHLLPPKARG